MQFDHRGLLQPPEPINITQQEFKTQFVAEFATSSTREPLYESFLLFAEAFQTEVTNTFTLWIGGSFTTKTLNPRDIDIVTFIAGLPEERLDTIKTDFDSRYSKLDLYYVDVRQPEDKKYAFYRSDYLYWYHLFSKTRSRRGRKPHPRGFVELTFNDSTYE